MATLSATRSGVRLGATPHLPSRRPVSLITASCIKLGAHARLSQLAEKQGLAALAPSRAGKPTRQAMQVAAFFKREAPPPIDPSSPEQVSLRSSAGWQKSLSFVAFWLQLALTVVSAGVLVFSLMVTNPATTVSPVWPRYFTAGGIVFAFLSTFFAHGFLRLSRNLASGQVVAPAYLNANLLRCNALNVVGIATTVIGLQAAVGTLVAKSLTASVQGAFTQGANALVSIDVFSLQAATNTVLSHVVSLIFTNLMLGVVGAARSAGSGDGASSTTPNGVALGADGMSPLRPSSLGYSPWNLKAD